MLQKNMSFLYEKVSLGNNNKTKSQFYIGSQFKFVEVLI